MPYENLLLNRKAVICKSVQRFPPETQKEARFLLPPERGGVTVPGSRNAAAGRIASAEWGVRLPRLTDWSDLTDGTKHGGNGPL